MRILYGVVGEGMGHATRSRVLLEALSKKHDVHVVVSGRAKDYLAQRFENVHGIWGLTLAYEENAVKKWQTLLQNVQGAFLGWPQNVRTYLELVEEFKPDVVVSDFESFSYLFGRNHLLPVISIDNMQIINRCRHDAAVLAGHEEAFELSRAVVKAKLPGCFHYLITTFFRPPVRKERTSLYPSILREEVLRAKSEEGEHLLVYQTSTSHSALPDMLRRTGLPCRLYGLRRDLTEDVQDDNLLYRPFSETTFIEDLRTARGVIAGGGYTLMSECVYLRKPMLSQPIGKHFEQVLNALYLEKLGYGVYAPKLTAERMDAFLDQLPRCKQRLADYTQDGNRDILEALDTQLERAAEFKGKWFGTAPTER